MTDQQFSLPPRWQEMEQQLERVTDPIGTPIDPGIMKAVTALNVLGVETSSSCEGHLQHGHAAPWVDFHAVDTEMIRKKALAASRLLQEAEEQHAPQETLNELTHEMFQLAAEERVAYYQGSWLVHQALEAFYLEHHAPYDQQLYLHNDSFGQSRLQPHGIDYQPQRPPEVQATLLKLYQQEMQAFATFLKHTYLFRKNAI
ncbi:hypothetical protein [Dictyobacter arantiisoli]|uniref:Uncharacterized protein n=1 Tax=Dictyobacter arantiisoli TaxID=2014874 RepID=A0A5A5TKA4_9CHLR|nr:hypothetical protein [Dictyobacter arantiisoli]GCF11685.1 hypothetical protein KDI_52490 [Dictyobacter arantiisoli]